MSGVRFGLILSQYKARWEHVAGDARVAEEHGLDSVWLTDHLTGVTDPAMAVFEGWTALAAVAALTDRVRLGHLVTSATFRNVGVLAKMATTIDHASGGRLELGLGAGWHQGEHDAFDIPFPAPGARRRLVGEVIDALDRLFTGEPVDYAGDFVRLRGAGCSPPPLQQPRPPLTIGTAGPLMMALTGRRADAWNCPAGALGRLDEARATVQEAAGGRAVRTSIQVPVAVGRDAAEAEAAREAGRRQLTHLDEHGIVGTVDEAVVQVAAYRDRGVDEFICLLPTARTRPDYIAALGELAAAVR